MPHDSVCSQTSAPSRFTTLSGGCVCVPSGPCEFYHWQRHLRPLWHPYLPLALPLRASPTASLLLLLLPPQLLPGGAGHESAWPRFPADERLPDTARGGDDPAASRGLRGAFRPDPAAPWTRLLPCRPLSRAIVILQRSCRTHS
jgi:hypothetical protein